MELRDTRNRLLQQLSVADRRRLAPHLTEQPVAFKQPLHEQGQPVDRIYFVESGVISIVTDLKDGGSIETGTVGNEGFVGIAAVLGGGRSLGRVFCQIPGSVRGLGADSVEAEREHNSPLFRMLLRYTHFVMAMMGQSAACNRMHSVDSRMSRWLLMTHDRVEADEFPLTQEFLAQMLGVARPTVNIAGATLQRAGFIKYSRGRITVIDRRGLEAASCECYQRIKDELEHVVNGDAAASRRASQRRHPG